MLDFLYFPLIVRKDILAMFSQIVGILIFDRNLTFEGFFDGRPCFLSTGRFGLTVVSQLGVGL